MKTFLQRILPLIIVLWAFSSEGFSQCSNCNSNYPSGTHTTSSDTWTNITTCNYGGEYAYCDL
ncbi:MAG: hypothetical protein ACQES1_09890, partial [Bacteroidota bacterium]